MRHLPVLALASLAFSVTANAATITRQYTLTSEFRDGAPTVTQMFALTFDPFVQQFDSAFLSYSTNSGLLAFNNGPIVFSVFTFNLSTRRIISFSGMGTAGSRPGGQDDFLTNFEIDAFGNPLAIYPDTQFGLTFGGASYGEALGQADHPGAVTRAVVSEITAVPEPATWAMMMLGFGGLGYAMRRKNKVSTRIRFA